jgi:hypothetical protein
MNQDVPGLNVVRPVRWQHPPPPATGSLGGGAPGAQAEPEPLAQIGRVAFGQDDVTRILARLEPALAKLRDDTAEMKLRLSAVPNVWELAALMTATFGLAYALLRFGLPTF